MPTANADPEGVGNAAVDIFRNIYGVQSTYIPITVTSDNANDPSIRDLILQQTGIFFVGGYRQNIVYTLLNEGKDTLAMTAIRQILRAGGVIAGTSAGMGSLTNKVMLINGLSWVGLVYGVFQTTGLINQYPNNLSYDPDGGIKIFNDYVLDSHFSEMGREARLIKLLQETRDMPVTGTSKGIGVDEDTALAITDLYTRPIGTVIGSTGGVFYVDVQNLIERPSNTSDYQVMTSFLTLDDRIDLTTGEITFANWKSNIAGNEWFENAVPSPDIFSTSEPGEWRKTAQRLIDNKKDDVVVSYSAEKNPQFQVVMNRQTAVRYGGDLANTTTFVASYQNMTVFIRPV